MTAWFERAACRGMDAELFFPARGEMPREALAVCRRCDVANQCLDYCLSLPAVNELPPQGVWGGTTMNERKKLGMRGAWQANEKGKVA